MAQQESTGSVPTEHNGDAGGQLRPEEAGGRGRGAGPASSVPAAESALRIDPQTMQRAEEAVDRLAERISSCVQQIGRQVLWLAARAREEAEDIWAEAESLRRRQP